MTLTILSGAFIASSLVLASGILPVSYGLLLLGGGGTGAISAMPAARYGHTRIRFVLLAILAFVVVIVVPTSLFLHFQRTGLAYAKQYGGKWAGTVERFHQTNGRWPASLEAATRQMPTPALQIPWPYRSSCRGGVCENVAGYYVVYLPESTPPTLRIARRDIRTEWDWSLRQWKTP